VGFKTIVIGNLETFLYVAYGHHRGCLFIVNRMFGTLVQWSLKNCYEYKQLLGKVTLNGYECGVDRAYWPYDVIFNW